MQRRMCRFITFYNVVNLYLVKASALHIFLRIQFQIKKCLLLAMADPEIRLLGFVVF